MSDSSKIESTIYSALCNVDLFPIGFTGTYSQIFDIVCINTDIQSYGHTDKYLEHILRKCLEIHNNCRDNKQYSDLQLRDISKTCTSIKPKRCIYTFGCLF